MNKRISAPWSIALATTLGAVLLAPPARAQEPDGAAPPAPAEPVNPKQAPAPAPAPAPAAPAAPAVPPPSEPVTDSDETPGMESAKPSPALIFLPSRREAASAREKQRSDRDVELPDDGKLRYHQDHWIGLIGARVGRFTSPGLDPFAASDEVAQISLGLGGTVLTAGNFSLAGLFLYDAGGRSGTARGAASDLTIHRLTLGAEGRYHFFRQLFAFGRVAPGALHSIASIDDDWGVENRAARNWVFAADLSAGAMFELAGWVGNSRKRRPSAWISFEGGYGYAGETELTMTPDEPGNGPERGEPVELGPLALSGPFLRTALVVTY
jgi:hypothetical protein